MPQPKLLYGDVVDRRLNWPLGRSEHLARRKKLPHVILPDGSVRFEWESVVKLLQHVAPVVKDEEATKSAI